MRRFVSHGPARVRLAICIPARDEAARLPRLFDALARLTVPPGAAVDICLLLDGCTDASAAIAARSAMRVHVAEVPRGAPSAGLARARAMALGVAVAGSGDAVLLTTDADSRPRADWLLATLAALDRADVVAGDVVRELGGGDAAQDRIERYYAALFAMRRRVDPVAWEAPRTHHHASGANLALRCEAYLRLGGFAPIPSGEDARLVDDAARAGLRVRRDAASVVETSARRDGRAVGGLAATLRALDRDGSDGVRVAHPADQIWQYRHHALARGAFADGDLAPLSAAIGLGPDHLLGVARDCPNAEAFAMRVVPVAPGGMRSVSLARAEAALARIVAEAAPAEAA